MVRFQISEEAASRGLETFEEANDFDISDDPVEPHTPYEEDFDPVLGRGITADEIKRNPEEFRQAFQQASQTFTRDELFEMMGIDPAAHAEDMPSNGAAVPPQGGSAAEGGASGGGNQTAE